MQQFENDGLIGKEPAILRTGLLICLLIALLIAVTSQYINGQSVIVPQRYYTFNGTAAGADSTGTADLNFSFYGCQYVQSADALVGKCLTLSTTGDLIHGGTLDLDTALTVEFLIRTGHGFNNTGFVRRGDGAFDIRINYPEIYFATEYRATAGNTVFDELKITLDGVGRKAYGYYTDGEWHHLVFRFSGTTGRKEVWVDGQLPDGFSRTVAAGTFQNPSGNNRTLYLNHIVNYLKYSGSIDEVAIYNRGIPAALIYKHYTEAQLGRPYSYVNDYIQPLPAASPVTAPLDPLDFPPGHPSPTVDVVTQLKTFPVPRYRTGNTLHPNFQWIDPTYFGGRLQPGVTDAQASATGVAIQTELARTFNYMLQVGGPVPVINDAYVNLANQNPQWKVSLITYRAQIGTKLWNTTLPDDHYLQNASGQFIDANGNPGNKTWRPTAPVSSYSTDGQTQRSIVTSIIQNLTRNVDFVNENGEVFSPYQNSALAADPVVSAARNASGLGWEDFLARQIKDNDVLAYRDGFMTLPKLQNASFSEYRIDGHRDWQFRYEEMKFINKPIGGKYYSTADFYPRWPSNWKTWQGPWHGIKWIVEARYHEIQDGDKLFSPYVAAGWDENPERDVRPGQWLGLLKCLGMLGAEFYYSGYFNEAPSYMPPNPPPNDPRGYAWQAVMPSYAQAVTSRFEDVLRNGSVMEGDLMNDYTSPTSPGYQFSAGDVRKVVMVRKKDNADYYAITGTIQPNTNMTGNAETEGLATITLDGRVLTFPIRKQGSTYIYDRTVPSKPVFYQLDGWHEASHPAWWSTGFALEAELYDNAGTSFNLKTTVPAGAAAGDYSQFTTCITFPDGQIAFTPVEYRFTPRNTAATTYYFWVRARTRTAGQPSGLGIRVDNGATRTIDCIADTAWRWYRLEGCTQQAIAFAGLNTAEHILSLAPANDKLEIDRMILTADAGLTMQPAAPGCSGSGSATITAGGPTAFCPGGQVTLTASAGTAYQWSTGATTQSITVDTSGAFVVTVTNGTGCAGVSTPMTVTVNTPAIPIITPGGTVSLNPGQTATLTASSGTAYAWNPGGETTQSITTGTAGMYRVAVTDANGCSATSAATTVALAGIQPVAIAASGPTAICDGDSVELTATAGLGVYWLPGWQTTSTIWVSEAGTYTVNASNGTSAQVTVTMLNRPMEPSIAISYIPNAAYQLTAYEPSAVAYSWSTGSTQQTITVVQAQAVTVTATNAFGCSTASAALQVTSPVTQPCAQVTMLSVTDLIDDAATLTWNPAVTADSFLVVCTATGQATLQRTVPGNVASVRLTGLVPGTAYDWHVRSHCNGTGITSSTATFTTLSGPLACGSTPIDMHSGEVTESSVLLDWYSTTATTFLIRYKKVTGTFYAHKERDGTTGKNFSYLFGLEPATTYEWSVRAECNGTVSLYSPARYFTTAPACASPGPADIQEVTHKSALIAWNSQAPVDTLKIVFGPVGSNDLRYKSVVQAGSNGRTALGRLIPDTDYFVLIKSKCGDGGRSPWLDTLFFHTLPAPVLRPENPMELNAYPNPARDHVTYAFVTDKEGDYRLRVCDMAGRELYRTVRQAWEGDNSDDLSLAGLTPGVYVLILEQGPVSGQFRIAVQ